MPSLKDQRGIGLVEVIIFSAIALFTLNLLNTYFGKFNKVIKHREIEFAKMQLKNYLQNATNCQATTAALTKSCSSKNYIAIKSKSGEEDLIESFGSTATVIGNFKLRAFCAACDFCSNGKKIVIESQLVDSRGNTWKNPITRLQGWNDLYPEIPFGCAI